MAYDRAMARIQHRANLETNIADAYSRARCFGQTSAALSATVAGIIAKAKTQRDRAYLQGYSRALSNQLYRDDLVYGCFIDGRFYSTHRDRADYYQTQGMEPSIYADKSSNGTRGHYWSHNLKPFFIG